MALPAQRREQPRSLHVVRKQEPGFILIPAKVATIDGPVDLKDGKKPVARLYLFSVYQALAKYAGESDAVWPRVKTLADALDCSEDLIHRVLRALEKVGAIAIEQRFEGGMKLPNRYVLTHQKPIKPDAAVNGIDTATNGKVTAVNGNVAAVNGIELEQENYNQELEGSSPLTPQPETEAPTETDAGASKKTTREPRKKNTVVPKDFALTPELQAWGEAKEFLVSDLEAEVEPFVDYWTGRGVTRASWEATFRNWMQNQRKWNKLQSQQQARPPGRFQFSTQPDIGYTNEQLEAMMRGEES